jgi:integrase
MSRVPRDELDKKASKRKVYIRHSDAVSLFNLLPKWSRPMAQTIYYTGIRVGEALELTRNRVDLNGRMIFIRPGMANEDVWKRVPIHRELLPVLESYLTATTTSDDACLSSGTVMVGTTEFKPGVVPGPTHVEYTALKILACLLA